MKIVAFANQKGGVGKTTTAVTLAHGLALRGQRTLLVDLDPQGHAALTLGYPKSAGLYRLICEGASLSATVIAARPNLDLLSSDKHTELVKRQILQTGFTETVLLDILRHSDYAVVMLDLAPSLDVLHISGLVAADFVIIPTRLDALAVDGVKEILLTMGEIASRGHRFTGYAILPTFFDRSTRETLAQLKEITRVFGSKVWPPIPQDTRAREAAAYGQTLIEYNPRMAALAGYRQGRVRAGGYDQVLERLIEVLNDE